MTRMSLVLTALAAAASATVTNRTCYYPDGTASPDTPCSNAKRSHCCNAKNACLSTGYCMSVAQQPFVLSRGSCTDSAWGSGCPARCAGSTDNPGGGRPISWMGTKNSAGAYLYCCGTVTVDSAGDLACEDDASSFTLGAATIMYGAGILANTTTAAADAASSTDATSGVCSSDTSTTTAVGAGVGASLGAVAAAALSWALWERRKRTRMLQDLQNGRLPAHVGMTGDGSADGSAALGYGKVYSSPAELSAYSRQELPAQ